MFVSLSRKAAAWEFTMAYNFETDASSSRTDEVGGEKEGDMVEGAVVCCASIPTTWDGWVKAGGAEGRKWRGREAWLKVVGVWAGGRAGVAQHPDFPVFQYQRKSATPSRMMTVDPDKMMFM